MFDYRVVSVSGDGLVSQIVNALMCKKMKEEDKDMNDKTQNPVSCPKPVAHIPLGTN